MTEPNKYVHMGLGDAIRRLLEVEIAVRYGIGNHSENLKERDMLLHALNHIPLSLGFDCNQDGTPDTVEIFREAASSSCCRLVSLPDQKTRKDTSRGSRG